MTLPSQDQDALYMQLALDIAALGAATTQPNPMVGCVIVNDGEIVGEGYHQRAGELHAERIALAEAGAKARGATVYVNLEPCCHQGRTPPCIDGLIDAGVSRVVAAMRDPNPMVKGSGFDLLAGAGVEVLSPVLEEQAKWLNRGFVSRMSRNRPWLKLKSAATLDGRTADAYGASQWITGSEARVDVHALRANSSAIITGIDTVLADDPSLNVRAPNVQRQPLRVVLDSQLQIPLEAKIIGDDQRLVVFTASDDLDKTAALIEAGAEVIQLPANPAGKIDLKAVLHELAKWECNEVLLEAGQTLSGAFLEAGLVDEMVLFYAGSLLGDRANSMFRFSQAVVFDERPEFNVNSVNMVGSDFRVDAVNAASLDEISRA